MPPTPVGSLAGHGAATAATYKPGAAEPCRLAGMGCRDALCTRPPQKIAAAAGGERRRIKAHPGRCWSGTGCRSRSWGWWGWPPPRRGGRCGSERRAGEAGRDGRSGRVAAASGERAAARAALPGWRALAPPGSHQGRQCARLAAPGAGVEAPGRPGESAPPRSLAHPPHPVCSDAAAGRAALWATRVPATACLKDMALRGAARAPGTAWPVARVAWAACIVDLAIGAAREVPWVRSMAAIRRQGSPGGGAQVIAPCQCCCAVLCPRSLLRHHPCRPVHSPGTQCRCRRAARAPAVLRSASGPPLAPGLRPRGCAAHQQAPDHMEHQRFSFMGASRSVSGVAAVGQPRRCVRPPLRPPRQAGEGAWRPWDRRGTRHASLLPPAPLPLGVGFRAAPQPARSRRRRWRPRRRTPAPPACLPVLRTCER